MVILCNQEHPTSQVIACPQSTSTNWRNSWHPLGPAPTCWHHAREKWVWGWGGAGNKLMGSLSDICTAQLMAEGYTALQHTCTKNMKFSSPCPSRYNFIWCWPGWQVAELRVQQDPQLSLLADSFPSLRDVSPLSTKRASQQLVDI